MLLPQTLTPLAAGGLSTITNLAITIFIVVTVVGVATNSVSWYKSREMKAPFVFLAIFIVSGVIVALALLFDPNSPLYVVGTKFITDTATQAGNSSAG